MSNSPDAANAVKNHAPAIATLACNELLAKHAGIEGRFGKHFSRDAALSGSQITADCGNQVGC